MESQDPENTQPQVPGDQWVSRGSTDPVIYFRTRTGCTLMFISVCIWCEGAA
jgi:hypothetical protein